MSNLYKVSWMEYHTALISANSRYEAETKWEEANADETYKMSNFISYEDMSAQLVEGSELNEAAFECEQCPYFHDPCKIDDECRLFFGAWRDKED